jgi:hypothetical protein
MTGSATSGTERAASAIPDIALARSSGLRSKESEALDARHTGAQDDRVDPRDHLRERPAKSMARRAA